MVATQSLYRQCCCETYQQHDGSEAWSWGDDAWYGGLWRLVLFLVFLLKANYTEKSTERFLECSRKRHQNHVRIAADEATTQWAWCLCASSSLRLQMPMYTALSSARIPRSSQTVIHRISPMVSSWQWMRNAAADAWAWRSASGYITNVNDLMMPEGVRSYIYIDDRRRQLIDILRLDILDEIGTFYDLCDLLICSW